MDGEEFARLLRKWVLPIATEIEMQDAIETVLTQSGIDYRREADLGECGVIDFMIGSMGVECKVDGGKSNVVSQLLRYAQCDSISEIVLVTSRSRHRLTTPKLNGKDVSVVWCGGM